MTKEEKQILLNDLKCRLYTKTQCQCIWSNTAKNGSVGAVNELDTYILDELERIDNPNNKDVISDIEPMFSNIKPYLRPMSSMSVEEKREYEKTFEMFDLLYLKTWKTYDWLNEHYFDYHGLIKLGLALEAPEGMYVK